MCRQHIVKHEYVPFSPGMRFRFAPNYLAHLRQPVSAYGAPIAKGHVQPKPVLTTKQLNTLAVESGASGDPFEVARAERGAFLCQIDALGLGDISPQECRDGLLQTERSVSGAGGLTLTEAKTCDREKNRLDNDAPRGCSGL